MLFFQIAKTLWAGVSSDPMLPRLEPRLPLSVLGLIGLMTALVFGQLDFDILETLYPEDFFQPAHKSQLTLSPSGDRYVYVYSSNEKKEEQPQCLRAGDRGKEVLSDGRRQLQYFIDPDLETFTFTRNKKTKDLKDGTFGSSLYKSIDTYLCGFADSIAGTTIEMQVSKLEFVKNIQIRNATSREIKSKLLYQLSNVTLLPRVIDGELVSSRITTTL